MNYNPSKKETELIREALFEFNREKVGDDGHTPLNIVEYDADGNIIGGILGGTYWGRKRGKSARMPSRSPRHNELASTRIL